MMQKWQLIMTVNKWCKKNAGNNECDNVAPRIVEVVNSECITFDKNALKRTSSPWPWLPYPMCDRWIESCSRSRPSPEPLKQKTMDFSFIQRLGDSDPNTIQYLVYMRRTVGLATKRLESHVSSVSGDLFSIFLHQVNSAKVLHFPFDASDWNFRFPLQFVQILSLIIRIL